MKVFLIFLVLVVFAFTPNLISDVFSLCAVNGDWKNAPCYDMGPITKEQFQTDWAPYYDYKGKEWMESKKIELYDVINNGTLKQWVRDPANANVYNYYVSTDVIQKQSEGYVPTLKHETLSYKLEILVLSLPLVGAAILGYFVIKRRRKK